MSNAHVTSTATQALADNGDVVFEASSSVSAITLGGANTLLTVSTAGTYLVSWQVSTAGSSGTLAMTVNGTVHPMTRWGLGGGSAKLIGGQAIIMLAAGDTITLRNVSTTTFTISLNGNGGGGNSASMTLLRLN